MQHALSQTVPRADEKIAAADEKTERAKDEREPLEKLRELEALLHAEVARQSEEHRVHRQRSAEAEAEIQRAAGGCRGFSRRPDEVAEGLQFARECDGIEHARLPAERELAERGIHVDRERARFAREKFFDEPSAADAREALHVERERSI